MPKYPPFDRSQVESILKKLHFHNKRQKASHAHWEGYTKERRRIVTVDHLNSKKEKYGPELLGKMIKQSSNPLAVLM